LNSFKQIRGLWLGEHHNSLSDHLLQASIIKSLRAKEPKRKMALGLEAVQRQYQPVLDDYVTGRIALKDVKRLTMWEARWSWPFENYAPVFLAAKQSNMRLLALNANSEDLALVEKGGLEALPHETMKQYVPSPLQFANFGNTTAFKEYVSYVILPSYNCHAEMGILKQTITGQVLEQDMTFKNFYSGRMLWDISMASVSSAWTSANPSGLFVGVIGADHVKFGCGVPNRYAFSTGMDLDSVKSVILNPSAVDTAKWSANNNNDQVPLTLQLQFGNAGDGDVLQAAATVKQVKAGSSVLPFADFMWLA
ncbi:hypothetical protein TL16_g03021, partial [Triparma laevis f. inornata]